MGRHINDAGLKLIKSFEALRLFAYKAPEGQWAIGYGHSVGVTEGMSITTDEADQLLRGDLEHFEAMVEKSVAVELNENEFSALVCFAYNVRHFPDTGVVKMLNSGHRGWALSEWSTYDKAHVDGKLVALKGLTRRRKAELTLFLKPIVAGVT